jgi:hypothetical protein
MAEWRTNFRLVENFLISSSISTLLHGVSKALLCIFFNSMVSTLLLSTLFLTRISLCRPYFRTLSAGGTSIVHRQ